MYQYLCPEADARMLERVESMRSDPPRVVRDFTSRPRGNVRSCRIPRAHWVAVKAVRAAGQC
jgi:hypothetical protein